MFLCVSTGYILLYSNVESWIGLFIYLVYLICVFHHNKRWKNLKNKLKERENKILLSNNLGQWANDISQNTVERMLISIF